MSNVKQTSNDYFLRSFMSVLRISAAVSALFISSAVFAQMTPVGTWRSIDDATKEPKVEIVLSENNGVIVGKVIKLLRPSAKQDAVCTECTDDRKDKPLLGMEMIRGAKKVEGKNDWEGGTILDPESGKTYRLKLTPVNEGKELEVRGYIAFFSRMQTWVRLK
jgi:uncharacterized protein (DUF2147 family)